MKVQILGTVLLSAFIILSSCSKDEEPQLTQKDVQLTSKEWKITGITRKSIANPGEDSSILKTCSTDDRLLFATNHQFQLKDGTTKCDSAIFQYDAGSWSFSANQSVLALTGAKRNQSWKILTLNDSTMKVEWLDSLSANNKVLKTIALKNK
jgi:hypothetical protein